MGVRGLVRQLHKNYSPISTTLTPGQAAEDGAAVEVQQQQRRGAQRGGPRGGGGVRQSSTLLVDGTSVFQLQLRRLGLSRADYVRGNGLEQVRALYLETLRFFSDLLRTGLTCTCVVRGGSEPGHELVMAKNARDRCRSGTGMFGPLAEMAFEQALVDLGVEVCRSAMGADTLLYALYLSRRHEVFAVVSDDTDLLVYGVENLAFPDDISLESNCVTFFLWSSAHSWLQWRRRRQPDAKNVSLMQRAQVAALLGSNASQFARASHEMRHAPPSERQNASKKKIPSLPSPVVAAELALLREDLPLDLPFFKTDLNMKGADEKTVSLFEDVAEGYMNDAQHVDHIVRRNAISELLLTPESMPWVSEKVAQRLSSLVAPRFLRCIAMRGFAETAGGLLYEDDSVKLRGAREDAVQMMLTGTKDASASASSYEYNPYRNCLYTLSSGSVAELPETWFSSEYDLPGVNLVDMTSSESGKGALDVSSFEKTVEALRSDDPDTKEIIALYHALLLHIASPSCELALEDVREWLLPSVPLPDLADDALAAVKHDNGNGNSADNGDHAHVGADVAVQNLSTGLNAMEVDVGSSLSAADWSDIDNKDVVAKARAHPGFRLMGVIQPWDPLREAPDMAWEKAFQYFYLQRKKNDMWKKLAKACFPDRYAEVSKDKSSLSSASIDQIMEELRKPRGGSLRTARWLEAFQRGTPLDMLSLRRLAILGGPRSAEWAGAKTCWGQITDDVKLNTFETMHTSLNKEGFSGDGPPRRYKHQQQVIDMVDSHLHDIRDAYRASKPAPLPKHIILCTPTGSGKTFTALMMYQQMLKDKHPNTLLLYSVPTKQVLKAVGQQCEAHQLVYWTAARDGELHQVRRPYSVRNPNIRRLRPDEWQKYKGHQGTSGTIDEQFALISEVSKALLDKGNGRPGVIIADIMSTVSILKAAREQPHDSWYHHSRIVLYFDEPNMGVHLDPNVLSILQQIMCHVPDTAILASATLSRWSELPAYWRGNNQPATRVTVSQEPYELPMAKLQVMNLKTNEMKPIHPLQLFRSQAECASVIENYPRRRVLMLRYFSPKQANDLLGSNLSESERASWNALYGDVGTLRESLEPTVHQLALGTPERYNALSEKWEQPVRQVKGLLGAFSREGVTLVATLRSREMAFKLAGIGDEEGWSKQIHRMKARIREAARTEKSVAKEAERKKDEDEDPGMDAEMMDTSITLRSGMTVSLAECKEADEDELVMLSKGIAFAHSGTTSPVVKRLYQQALLSHPDHTKKTGKQPPINVLVVDYSSIYGTDCPAVDTIILMPDLGRKLAWEDHQQFLGRLRRDGTAIYLSHRMLRYAILGDAVELGEEGIDGRELRQKVASIIDTAESSGGSPSAIEAASKEFQAIPLADGANKGEVAGHLVSTLLMRSIPRPAETMDEADAISYGPAASDGASVPKDSQIVASLKERMDRWGPCFAQCTKTAKEEVSTLNILAGMAERRGEGYLGLPAIKRFSEGQAAARILKLLYDDDHITEEGMLLWASKTANDESKFKTSALPFINWLEEADEESDEEDEDDDE